MKIDRLEFKYNDKIVKTSTTIDNSDSQFTAVNWTLISIAEKPTFKLFQLLTISIPKDDTDQNCQRVLLKTRIDMCRMMDVQATFYAKAFMETFANASNFAITSVFDYFNNVFDYILACYVSASKGKQLKSVKNNKFF